MHFPTAAGIAILLSLGLFSCSSPNQARPSAKAISTKYTVEKNVIFTPAGWPKALPADLYRPEGSGPFPGVLLIYGGSWSSTDHRWQMQLIARKLARRGYVVLSATYSGTPEYQYPAPLEDLREALRWLRTHAGELRLSSDKIAAYGFSSGGHLAELIGTVDGPADVRVQAVVAASAPSDLTLFTGGTILPSFLGATLTENPARFREASPVNHVSSDDPPMFLYQGTADTTVPPEHSRVFKAALDRAGVRNELRWVEGRGHGGILLRDGGAEDAAIDFLDEILR